MTAPQPDVSPKPAWRAIALVCALLALYHIWLLPGAWAEWHRGAVDVYRGQHRGLLLGHVSGLALALAIPLPGLMTTPRGRSRGGRLALWVIWVTLMTITLASFVLEAR